MWDTSPVEPLEPNDPCPCGSGKKFKRCHGRPEGEDTEASRPEPVSPPLPTLKPGAKASREEKGE
jgi:hypothetical protein